MKHDERGNHFWTVAALAVVVSGCGQGALEMPGLKHWVIDANPNTGVDCCTDVLMLGDLSGDGNPDVIIGAENAEKDGLVWYEFPTWRKQVIANGSFTTDGQALDMDGDADLDVVVGTFVDGKGEVLWFENVPGGGPGRWKRHVAGTGYVHDLAVADLDRDGDADIVTGDKKGVAALQQVSPGVFVRHALVERAGEGIAIADIDSDEYPDVVYGGSWLRNPGAIGPGEWQSHAIAPGWSADTRVAASDMNADGRSDVVLSVSEGKGTLAWFESPADVASGAWVQHVIEERPLEGVHSLQVADIDRDGKQDVIAAEMHTAPRKRIIAYLGRGAGYEPRLIASTGSHNMRVADLDGDGDIDLVGKNYAGKGRAIEWWENTASDSQSWDYASIGAKRPRTEQGKMGLVFADLNRDGLTDVAAGSFAYLNPGPAPGGAWRDVRLAKGVDVYFAIDADRDGHRDLVGLTDSEVLWLEARDESAASWSAAPVQTVAKGRTQGYAVGQLWPGEHPQLIFTRGRSLWALDVPVDLSRRPWPIRQISSKNEEEGIGLGDIDGDGDLDIAAVQAEGHQVMWLENPGSGQIEWPGYLIGGHDDRAKSWLDRIAVADVNGDRRLDILATEERQDHEIRANLYWFEAPEDPRSGSWTRHVIATHRSLNSMDVADVNSDGLYDISVAEHTDQTNDWAEDSLTVVYLNGRGGCYWRPFVVERGPHSSHLGARWVDLDDDGFNELVSIGWTQFQHVHSWRKRVAGIKDEPSSRVPCP